MRWNKVDVENLVDHPWVEELSCFQYRKFLRFLWLALREEPGFGPLGVVDLRDNQIALKLDISEFQCQLLLDALWDQNLIRQVEREDGRLRYEVNPLVLPDATYTDSHSLVHKDGRREFGIWTNTVSRTTFAPPETAEEADFFTTDRKGHKASKKARQGRYRVALSRYRKSMEKAHNRRPSSKEESDFTRQWQENDLLKYPAGGRQAVTEPTAQAECNTPVAECNAVTNVTDRVTAVVSEGVTGEPGVTSRVSNRSESREREEILEEENNNNTRAGVLQAADVTPEKAVVVVEQAVTFLSGTGVTLPESWGGEWVQIARDEARRLAELVFAEDGQCEWIYESARRLPYYRGPTRGGSWGGYWISLIEGRWPEPPAYQRYKKEQAEAAARKVQEEADRAERARAAEENERLEAALAGFEIEHYATEESQALLESEALRLFEAEDAFNGKRFRETLQRGEKPSAPQQQAFETYRRQALEAAYRKEAANGNRNEVGTDKAVDPAALSGEGRVVA